MTNQLKALRGMLACTTLCKSDAIDAGIDACRSDTYRAKLAQFTADKAACLDYNKRKSMQAPRAEPVKGSTELREWLSAEYDRIVLLREKRSKLARQPTILTLRQRCLQKVSGAVREAYDRCNYRKSESGWAGGEHIVGIQAGAAIASARGFSERAWSSNGKWSGTNSTHKITVQTSWYSKVYKRGMAEVDGLLTLDAKPAQEPLEGSEEAFEAIWAVQGRGVALHEDDGVLYRKNNGPWVHGTSLKNARTLNNNRLRALVEERIERAQRRSKALEEMKALDGLMVTREDCTAVGLCDPGQRDWLAKRGLEEEIQSLPAMKLLEMAIVANDRVPEVRRAIRHAASKVQQVAA